MADDNGLIIENGPVNHPLSEVACDGDLRPAASHILVVGLNHKTAPLEIRERVAFSKWQLPHALSLLRDQAGDGVILSTCNRVEIYSVTESATGSAGDIRRFLTEYHGVPSGTLDPVLYEYTDIDAARHLFRVASGLDSMVLGEWQVLGQVGQALTAACRSDSGPLPVILSRLFHGAVRAGRRVREEAAIQRSATSISYASVRIVQRLLGEGRQFRLLLIGAGEVGEMAARALCANRSNDLVIANRTMARGEELARRLNGRAISFMDLEAALQEVDVAIAATDAPEFIVTPQMVASKAGQRGRDLILIDLAVPRNIDPEVARLDKVRLFDIDDLPAIARKDLEQCETAASQAKEIVDEELSKFLEWWRSLEAVPLIKNLRQQAESIRKQELTRSLRKMPGLAPKQLELVDSLTRSIVKKLLHGPITSLKQEAGRSRLVVPGQASSGNRPTNGTHLETASPSVGRCRSMD